MPKFSFSIFNDKDPTKTLNVAYMSAFGIIFVLTVITHIITSQITDKQRESVKVSYNISAQRTAASEISVYAEKYMKSHERLDYDFLDQSIMKMERAHTEVVVQMAGDGDASLALSESIYRSYFSPPFHLNNQVLEFIKQARAFQKLDKELDFEKVDKTLKYLQEQASGTLVRTLDATLEGYQAETISKVAKQSDYQSAGVIIIILVLFLEATVIFKPLSEKIKSYHTLLIRQALEDPLTGLHNRRAFMKNAEAELTQAVRQELPLIVVLCDLDKFKSVNDNYGHAVGDEVLKHFAKILKKMLRKGDIVGRIGGEEFAIVLSRKTEQQQGREVLERLCKKVASTPCPYIDENNERAQLPYTVSMGFVALDPIKHKSLSIDDLLSEADKALYDAKEQGRNRVIENPMTNDEIKLKIEHHEQQLSKQA